MDFIWGIDLGKTQDPTSAVLVDRVPVTKDYTKSDARKGNGHDAFSDIPADTYDFHIRDIQIFDLNTPYHEIKDWIRERVTCKALLGQVQLAVDHTGAGIPIVEDFRTDPDIAEILWAITFTGGKNAGRKKNQPMNWVVPKKDLVGCTQLLLQKRRIKVHPNLHNADQLKAQLIQFQHAVKDSGHTLFEGKGRTHDDIVTALCSALWLSDLIPPQVGQDIVDDYAMPATLIQGLQPEPRALPSWRETLSAGPSNTPQLVTMPDGTTKWI